METNDKEEIVEQSSRGRQTYIGMEAFTKEEEKEQSHQAPKSKKKHKDNADLFPPKAKAKEAQNRNQQGEGRDHTHLYYLNTKSVAPKSSYSEGYKKPLETDEKLSLLNRNRSSSKIPSVFSNPEDRTQEQLDQAADNLPPFTRLLWHHIREKDYPKFDARDAFITVSSAGIAGLSLILYWLPTLAFAADNSDLFGPAATTVMLQWGVNFANFNLSAEATSQTLSEYFGRKLPDHVLKVINEKGSKKVLTVVRLGGFGVLSLVAALPFGVSVEGSLYEKIIVEVTTAFINNYGLNYFALNHYRYLNQKLTRNSQKRAINILKAHMTHTIDRAVREIISAKEFPKQLTPNTPLGPYDLVHYLADLIRDLEITPKTDISWGQFILRRLFPSLVGLHIPFMGMTGYNLNLFDIMKEWMPDIIKKWIPGDIASIISTVGFGSVFLYIAMSAAAITLMDFVDQITCNAEKSLARQLYATRVLLFNAVMLMSAGLSFGTSAYFITHNHYFNGDGFLAPYKILFLVYGILSPDLFNGFGGINFVRNVTEKCAEFWGSDLNKQKAHFALEMREFLNNLNNVMSDRKFIEGLEALSKEDLKALVNLPYHLKVETLIKIAKGEKFDQESFQSTEMIDLSNLMTLSTYAKYEQIPDSEKNQIKQELNNKNIDLDGAIKQIKSYGTTPLSKLKNFWSSSSKPKAEKDLEKQPILSQKQEDEPVQSSRWKPCTII